ncbi:MAG: c-type cytochrome [Verrucomicrobia bacterium]|nr:MAG: c-type cytochrome [Verrucomicrobiota bacterium]
MKRLTATIFTGLLLGCSAITFAALPVPDVDDGGINLPPGFRALVVADNLVPRFKSGPLRFLTVAPNGDIYAKFHRNGLVALRDTNGDGRADVIEKFGAGNGTCVLMRGEWLYYSTTTGVYRYPYTSGELVPTNQPQTIISGLPAGPQHDAKVFAFDGDGQMLVEVGSPFNVLSDPDRQRGAKGRSPEAIAEFLQTHGGFWRFDPDKLNQTLTNGFHFSTGHRHSLGLAWQPASSNFFMCMMGRDNMNIVDPDHYDELDNAERDAEEFHLLKEGVNIGWPTTYWDPIKKARMVAPEYGGDNHKRDDNPAFDQPAIAFPAHWAPLQMCLYNGTQFPEKYRGGMFLAFHGSWNRAPRPQAGYKVVFIPFNTNGVPTGKWDDFAEGFPGVEYFTNTRDARYRPCGVAVGPDGSLYIGETEKGRIWRVIYTGESSPAKNRNLLAVAAGQSYAPIDADTPGGKIYAQICAACHMPNGSGVPTMQPPLAGSAVVAGDTERLINVVLKGPTAVLPPDREKFAGAMPPFNVLTDADIAGVINYIRANFATNAPKVTVEQVAKQRAKL